MPSSSFAHRGPPPRRAAADPRRSTYTAALAQFEELLAAGRTATSASRPLPLFYAMSQAGRAISAARSAERWRLRLHGLGAPELTPDVLDVRVHRTPAKGPDDDQVDSFTGVGLATGTQAFAEVATLGEMWRAIPQAAELLPSSKLPTPLLLVPDVPEGPLVPWQRVEGTVVGYDGEPDDFLGHISSHFPSAAGVRIIQPQGIAHALAFSEHGYGLRVWWQAHSPDVEGHVRTLTRIGKGHGFEPRWLRPSVGGAAPSELLSWWALLFGLSMLARYEPAGWMKALTLDASVLAAPLQELLGQALERVPDLVLAELGS